MLEKNLVLIKPDAVERNLIGEILDMYEKAGLKIKAMRMEKISEEKAKIHYAAHEGRDYFYELVEFLSRSPIVAVILEGEDAIQKVRTLNGSAKNPAPDTIRGKYAISLTENSVHSSDSPETARREIALWFDQN
ncbi:MAG: nucleoside-diphosphate kinase [Sarcina sp.]